MKKWIDPVKNRPAKDDTLAIKGDFREFTDLVRKIVNKPKGAPKPVSSSPGPVAS